ncbi:MAG: hypothetical protein JO222_05235, partial [Frankiales bacterium]|nr:hypothetical protein [Frankiales bacterium]
MSTRTSPGLLVAAGVGCLALSAVALSAGSTSDRHRPATAPSPVAATAPADPTAAEIARTQQHLRSVPRDYNAWATLGLDYVQQAKVTIDPTYYPKATAALARSLRLAPRGNYVAMAGEAALAAARHDFSGALRWANRGLAIDPKSAVLQGALTDALTQLGQYGAAEAAARRMELLRPGADAEARLSYAAELRGDLPAARLYMRQALRDAVGPSDVAFARYYLGELDFNSGHFRAALHEYAAGLTAAPTYAALLEGRAKARAALGDTSGAIRDFTTVVGRAPQPTYVLEFGRLLSSLGRDRAAQQQFSVFRAEEQLFRANGVRLDTDQTLFEADYGDAQVAVASGRAALRTRPFLDTYDAYAW